ncbi:MAG: hypothetical protein KI793_26740 [Rivularia sp. (in: Bacteria)]|nr:hypothetical protein [Rivularia sp. MS3]
MENSLFDRVFRDGDGNIVIAQPPNPPLIAWGVASLLKLVFNSGQFYTGLDLFAFGCIFTWAWEELFGGVNYFRRGLGLIALIGILGSKIL